MERGFCKTPLHLLPIRPRRIEEILRFVNFHNSNLPPTSISAV